MPKLNVLSHNILYMNGLLQNLLVLNEFISSKIRSFKNMWALGPSVLLKGCTLKVFLFFFFSKKATKIFLYTVKIKKILHFDSLLCLFCNFTKI